MQANRKEAKWALKEKRFLAHVSGNVFAQTYVLVAGTVGAALTARELAPEGRGTLAVVVLYPQVGWSLLSFGLNVALVQFVAAGRLAKGEAGANAALFASLSSALGVIAVIVANALGTGLLPAPFNENWNLTASVILLVLGLVDLFSLGLLQGAKAITKINQSQMLGVSVLLLGFVAFVTALKRGVPGALLAYVLAAVTRAAFNAFALRSLGFSLGRRIRPSGVRAILGYGAKAYMANVIQLVNYRFDMLVLSRVASAAEIGLYSVATRLTEVIWTLPKAGAFVHFADAASEREERRVSLRSRSAVIAGFVVASGLCLSLASGWAIPLVFGRAFSGAQMALLYLVPGTVALGCTKIISADIAGRGRPELNALAAGIGAVTTLLITSPAYKWHGIEGVAIASSVSYAVIAAVIAATGWRLNTHRVG